MAVEPGVEVHAPDAHVLALADSGEGAAAYCLVDVASREPQRGGDLGNCEELVAGVDAGLARGLGGHAEHPSQQGGSELLEGAEERRDVISVEVGDAAGIREDQLEVRLTVHEH